MKITAPLLSQIAPGAKPDIAASLAVPLSTYLPAYGIDTPLRVAHFLAQAAHETANFRTLKEYASGKAYEGRKDLGNIQPGDGKRFKGRGIFQLTGRANYRAYGKRLGVDLENNPERAADPDISVRVACEYWRAKGLSGWADRDDIEQITRKINGGLNGFAERRACLARAKAIVKDDAPAEPVPPAPIEEEVPDAPIAYEPPEPPAVAQDGKIWTWLVSALYPILAYLTDWRVVLVLSIVVIGGLTFFIGRERIGDFLVEQFDRLRGRAAP